MTSPTADYGAALSYWKSLLTRRTETLLHRAQAAEAEVVWLRSVLDRWGISPGTPPSPNDGSGRCDV